MRRRTEEEKRNRRIFIGSRSDVDDSWPMWQRIALLVFVCLLPPIIAAAALLMEG